MVAWPSREVRLTTATGADRVAGFGGSLSAVADRFVASRDEEGALDKALDAAGVNLRPGEYLVLSAAIVLALAILGSLIAGTVFGILLALMAAIGVFAYLKIRADRRRAKFADQLVDTLGILAGGLRSGRGLPQALELVAQETRTVSASIGSDVLRSGVIAGLIGLGLVAIYLLSYYRLAGLVAIGGLVLSAALLWTIVAWFGAQFGLALTLAGVVGLIVAIGVSADSNIVYFENVKESYMSGRRVPTAVERAYESAISTIVKADVVSLIAAVLLYWLTVGAVRGFAFYLGLATILDLVISWVFMRPALAWLARLSAVEENPTLLGLPKFVGGTK